MPRYAQINAEGYVISDSHLSGVVEKEDMIPLEEGFDLTNKRWNGTEWEDYIPEPVLPAPTEGELLRADMDYLKMMKGA